MTFANPLRWPDHQGRTPETKRLDGTSKFRRGDWRGGYKTPSAYSVAAELETELKALGARGLVITTDLRVRQDGMLYASQSRGVDQSIAAYFDLDGVPMAMGQDMYLKAEHNIRSLTLAVAGLRQVQRHGGGFFASRAFDGFAALPPPDAERHWSDILCVSRDASAEEVHAAYRRKAKTAHPDAPGGSTEAFQAIGAAYRQAMEGRESPR